MLEAVNLNSHAYFEGKIFQLTCSGRIESIVKNLGLNLTTVYMGYSAMLDLVAEKYAKREGFIFFWSVFPPHFCGPGFP